MLPELTASMVVGAWLFVLARTGSNTLHSEDLEQDEAWRYDVNRINELRRQDVIYRAFHPLVRLLARFNRLAFREYLPEIGREIQDDGLHRFWLAEEYLAHIGILGLNLSTAYDL